MSYKKAITNKIRRKYFISKIKTVTPSQGVQPLILLTTNY